MTLPPEILEELAIERAEREARKAAAKAAEAALWQRAAATDVENRLAQIESALTRVMPFDQLSKLFLEAFAAFEETRIPPLRDEIKSLKAEIQTLKAELEDTKSRSGSTRYRGVWRSDSKYDLGDFVTYGGAMWHADALTKAKPGSGEGWTLAVRKGIDGRNGERGPPGPAGRDAPGTSQ
jgi:multidrug efflux pump subunit AcrA (membrane-fusion protein)